MATNLSPEMNLPVPGVGTEPGPQYASDINNCLTIIDGHDHTPDSGVPITPSALNINADLLMNNQNLITARSVRFTPQGAPISNPTDLGAIYESGVDLYYNDGSGNQIRITQSGGIAGTPGSIANLTPPASASYVAGNQTFVWESAALTPANMDFASAILRNLTVSSFGLTLSPPTLASDYTITLPQLPSSTLPLFISSSGAMGTQSAVQVRSFLAVAPTVQKFTTGAGTYTLPTSPNTPVYIRIKMVGGGGGGGGGGVGGAGGPGADTTFGTILTASGGTGGGANAAQGGAGGAAAMTAPAIGTAVTGTTGATGEEEAFASSANNGGKGGSSPYFSGAGTSGLSVNGIVNTGGGGSGGPGSTAKGGSGGGSGGFIECLVPAPDATYAYAIGAGGTAGAAGPAGVLGGIGGSGYIIIEEYYS